MVALHKVKNHMNSPLLFSEGKSECEICCPVAVSLDLRNGVSFHREWTNLSSTFPSPLDQDSSYIFVNANFV